ncbi:methyltransferase [Streptomyces thermoalcalitolerans]|uniref:O-methyltransferase n=1 Tax=Streptomyces thermoalcalitolerans TaxID=65605 RepID=A0ABN1NNP9_9ACTN
MATFEATAETAAKNLESGRTLRELSDLVTPMAIRVAITLRIAQKIDVGRLTAEVLAADTGTDADVLERILLHLVTVGVLTRNERGEFGLTRIGEDMLVESGKAANPPWLDLNTVAGRAELTFTRLLDVARTGKVAYSAQYGTSFWDDLTRDTSSGTAFDLVMARGMERRIHEIAKAYDWGSLGTVVDVGGGNGTLLAGLLHAHPGLRGTVLDRHAEPALRTFKDAGLSERATAISGSFLKPLPPGAGGYILSRIQSDWNDADVRTILGHCRKAAEPQGKIIIIDEFATEEGVRCNSEDDLRMLVYYGGKERTMEQVRALATDVGLSVESLRAAADWTIMELVPTEL